MDSQGNTSSISAESVARTLGGASRYPGGWKCRCPAHLDKHASLTVSDGDGGRLLVKCHAGCDQHSVIEALKDNGLWPERKRRSSIVGTYDYLDKNGRLLFQAVRFEPKSFRQRRRGMDGSWVWNLKGVETVPYRLPELVTADRGSPVFIVEGEKDVDRLILGGLVATCNPMGAGKWRASFTEYFSGRQVIILSDNDDPGRAHATSVASALSNVAAVVKVVDLPGLPEKGDVSDFLNCGRTLEDLVKICEAAPIWVGQQASDISSISANAPGSFAGLDKIVDPVTWEGEPPERRWMVRSWVPWGRVTALYGDGGTGKTLLAQMLATAAASGNQWLGLETAPCKVIMVACEDDADELWRRQAAINDMFDIDMPDLENVLYWPRATEDNILVTFDPAGEPKVHDFFHALMAKSKAFGAQLIIIDTAADVFGGNENIRSQVNYFLKAVLGKLAQEIDGSVILCAHPSVSGKSGDGYSGSTAWNNAVRSRLYLTKPKRDEEEDTNDDERVLERSKANYARAGDTIRLRWEKGVFNRPHERHSTFVDRLSAKAIFIKGLEKATAQGRPLSESNNASNSAPKVIADMPHAKAFTRRDLDRAMHTLFDEGRLKVEPYGQGGRSRHIVGVSSVP